MFAQMFARWCWSLYWSSHLHHLVACYHYRFLKGANRCHRCGLEWPGLAMPMVEIAGRCGDVPSTSTYHEPQETLVAYLMQLMYWWVTWQGQSFKMLVSTCQALLLSGFFGRCLLFGPKPSCDMNWLCLEQHGVRRSRRKTEGGRVAELWDIVKEHASE